MPDQLLHMSELVTTAARAVSDAINTIRQMSIDELERRGKVATGRTISTLATSVTISGAAITGTLTGEAQWQWVGNGRPPGGMPPIGPIRQWVEAKGLNISPWAVAKGIALRGSKDFRDKKTNVFMDAFEQYDSGKVKELEDRVGKVYEQQAIDLAIKNLK